jgi:malate synthase
MSTLYKKIGKLQVDQELYNLIQNEVMPGTGVDSEHFWDAFEDILYDLTPKNNDLLSVRDGFQSKIDTWHKENPNFKFDQYKQFLTDIGYLTPDPEGFSINPGVVDPEIATIAGPQLVVPINNARYALNAANARWGSLYDALYGTDIFDNIAGAEKTKAYNETRGSLVIKYAKEFLDQVIPLTGGSHQDAQAYVIDQNVLKVNIDGKMESLTNPEKFVGFQGDSKEPKALLFVNNNLHIEVQLDSSSTIGAQDKAGVSDLLIESAITAIQDCEDSVAAVDGSDKVNVYRNWLGLMTGGLEETFKKNGNLLTRKLASDRTYYDTSGEKAFTLPGRSILLVRNVGHLMTNPAIFLESGQEVPEGIMDAMITALISLHDIKKGSADLRNSKTSNMYVVKPKMHGPDEVAFACEIFDRVEAALGMAHNTIKMGIMDEERRTTVNLKSCINVAKERVIFINTGFLDRTGDEIHTSMHAGPFVRKTKMKEQAWIGAYENWNVDVGLECGLSKKAQIGKGMWAKPDKMLEMLTSKMNHPQAGANCAWVPSPTAATLHALHYHQNNVLALQADILNRAKANIDDILTIPLMSEGSLSEEEIQQELDNNIQGILGYVVRWIDQGVGCSAVPDIFDVSLMEDRATLRISSQHIANWLEHGVCTSEQVKETLLRMSKVVDKQNKHDVNYTSLHVEGAPNIALTAASDLIFKGAKQPSGYTEPLLHQYRLKLKSMA